MRTLLSLGTGLLLAGAVAAGTALAQTPPAAPVPPATAPATPPAPPPATPTEAPRPPGGPGVWGHGPVMGGPGMPGAGMQGPGMPGFHGPGGPHRWGPPPSRAASFRLERGDTEFRVRCAENESTEACVNAAATLLDRFNNVTPVR
ncbi:hypothetical protein [Roseomonas elaeocarpi]|uniref:Translation initiation factor IF-2 n=1 Tax=Roseomonas elaeocarpi TaxID=907779 RepID=A0ABV6JPZ3_9PROT